MHAGLVLLVEDDENDMFLISRSIQKAGYHPRIEWMRDGVEAIEYLEGTGRFSDRASYPRPTVILTDLKMPRANGIDFLQWLKANPAHAVIPTIVLTSSRLSADIKMAYEAGAKCYFVKPSSGIDLEQLIKVIFRFWLLAERPSMPGSKEGLEPEDGGR